MPTTSGDLSLNVGNVKVKQEKITPPSTPNGDPSLTDNLLDNILGERKPVVEPLQSSNEILADLFKVLNAAPPIIDSATKNDDTGHKHKKKHKKEKKSKKHKKRGRSSSDTDESSKDSIGDGKAKKVKKEKKEKKRDKRKSDNDGDDAPNGKAHKRRKKSKDNEKSNEALSVVIKREKSPTKDVRLTASTESKKVATKSSNETTVHVKQETKSDEKPKRQRITGPESSDDKKAVEKIQVSVSNKDSDGDGVRRKIVIKSLVNSAVYQDTLKEVDAKQKAREKEKAKHKAKERESEKRPKHSTRHRTKSKERTHERRHNSHSSSLSLSDEETYLRERERHYSKVKIIFFVVVYTV